MKKLFITLLIFAAFFGSYAQTYLFNSSTTAISTCTGTLYDDGGASGDYLTNQHNILTITPGTPGTSVQLLFTSWGVGTDDSLRIFNGPSTASPQLGSTYNSLSNPVGIQIMASASNPTGQLTLEWFSYATAAQGFSATIGCHTPCQQIIATIDSNNCIPTMSNYYIDVCYGDPVTFSAFGTYPENNAVYAQSDLTSLFIWDFGDGVIDTGQTVTHMYVNPSGYDVNLKIIDTYGCENINPTSTRVRCSSNPIVDVKPLPDACENDVIEFLVGSGSTSTIVINQAHGGASGTLSVADTTYLPDGSGISYTSSVLYTEFLPGATLTNASDFLGICASIFHSYSGDLDISLECPNGTTVMLADQPGGGVQFGEPPVPAASGPSAPCYGNMGVPYDYCWNTTPVYGTMAAEAATAPSHTFTNVCGNTLTEEYYPAGSYAPENPFTAFMGCPLNGTWTLHITDNIGLDEGYITAWSISINPALIPGGWSYDVGIDTITWSGPYLTITSDSTAEITPTDDGTFQYTMTIYDTFGCSYDTTLSIDVVANPSPDLGADTTVCEGSVLTLDAGPGNQYFWSNGAITQTILPDASGIYAITVTNSNGNVACYGSDTIEVVMLPWASVNLGPDLCETEAVVLDAQNPGFNYAWSNGANTQTTNISATGTYSVTVSYGPTNECGDVDSINVSVIPSPIVNLGPDQVMCRHEFRDFDVAQTSPQYSYLWSTSSTSPYLHVEGLPVGSVTYSVTVTGCDSRSDTVRVDIIACDLTIPNVITPNNDGYNDVFEVENLSYYPNSVLMVFNRWGKKIYETSNYLNDWDGENFADGTYYTILRVNYGEEEYEDHHGTLTIMRD